MKMNIMAGRSPNKKTWPWMEENLVATVLAGSIILCHVEIFDWPWIILLCVS